MKTKFLAALTCLVLCLSSLAGCNGGNTSDGEVNIPDYDANTDRHIILTSWYAPVMTEAALDTYIAAGFNEIMLQGNNIGGTGSPKAYEAALLCEARGLNYYLCCENNLDYILTNSEKYDELEHLVGIDVYDEPLIYDGYIGERQVAGLATLANYIEDFEAAYTDKNFFTNLHPMEAVKYFNGGTYKEYLRVTCEDVLANLNEGERWLSADSYPLQNSGSTSSSYYLKATWLANLAYLAECKYVTYKDIGIKTNFFIQAMPYETYHNRIPTYEDLSMQIYALMAFGYDSVNYFCYATPPQNHEFTDEQYALVDRDGNTTSIYDAAKKINHEILAFDHVYMQFIDGWKGVIPVIGTKNSDGYNESFDNLKDMTKNAVTSVKVTKGINNITADHDTLVGVMQDKDGNPGFMLVNYNETANKKSGNVTLTFSNAQKALVYRNGVKSLVEVKNNTLTLPLGVGEGVFVIPFGAK